MDSGTSFTGGAADDIFNAPNGTFTSLDKLNGGAGSDTLNWVNTGAITATPASATLTSIETVHLTNDNAITLDVSGSAFVGLTTLNATTAGNFATTLTGAATTDLSVTNASEAGTTGAFVVNGGKAVTVTTGVQLNAAADTGAASTVGATTAAAGAVSVTQSITSSLVTDAKVTTGGTIGVTGGTSISVTQNIAGTSAANTTALTGSIGVTHTGGAITATGNASTTDVTVTQSATVAAVNSATIGRIGVTAGAVNILDANRASATAAGTITTATVTNAGATTVNSGALKTLNIGGTLTTVDASTLGALTTPANTTLALNMTGAVSTGAVTIDTDITTLNIAGKTTASTINSLVASGAVTINVSGDAKVTLTGNTTAAATAITVTNTGGASFGTALGTGVTFTGGAGADAVSLGATTKAITMGAGNDTVTSAGLVGTGGSVAGGDGTDTIIMTDAEAAVADNNSTFNTKFTSFETLRISDASRQTHALLTQIGLPELSARDSDDYVRIAVELAKDREWLVQLRITLRDRMRASPLMDVPGFTRQLEDTLIQQHYEVQRKMSTESVQKIFLNVGAGHPKSGARRLPYFEGPAWREVRLDIDPANEPDILGSMLDMASVANESIDVIFSSHNIEHLYPNEIPQAMSEFLRVLKPEGYAVIACPDLQAAARLIADDKLMDVAYNSPAGPVTPFDIVFSHRMFTSRSNPYMSHHCGFTLQVLIGTLRENGFASVAGRRREASFELWVVATKKPWEDSAIRELAAKVLPN